MLKTTVCIVGHGPSLKEARKGRLIDFHDKVVRLKGTKSVLGSEDYGSKTTVICASTEVMGNFFGVEAEEYWAYPKNGSFDGNVALQVICQLERPVVIPLYFCNQWNKRFMEMGAKHPNVSTGMAAILISIKRWSPKRIALAGFDTLLNPEIKFDRNPEIPRTGCGPYPDHDWVKELELIRILEKEHGVKIECMSL